MAAPAHRTNGRSLAAEQAALEAAERATSSVLALDGWGRLEAEPHANGAAALEPSEPEPIAEPPAQHGIQDELEALREPVAAYASQVRVKAAPALRLFGPALVFGLAIGTLVGAGLRWLEARNAPPPPPPPPPSDPLSRLRRQLAQLDAAEYAAEVARQVRTRGAPPPPPPAPKRRFERFW